MERTSETKPVTIVAIGAGNRTNKYLEYAIRNPDRMKLVGVAELNDIRRHASRLQIRTEARRVLRRLRTLFRKPRPGRRHPDRNAREHALRALHEGHRGGLQRPARKTDRAVAARMLPHRRSGAAQRGHRRRLPRPAIPSLFHQDQGDRRLGPVGRDHIDQPPRSRGDSTEPHTDSSAACGAARRSPTRC